LAQARARNWPPSNCATAAAPSPGHHPAPERSPLCRAPSSPSRSASSRRRRQWAPTRAWLGAYKAALEPYDAGSYFNFVEHSFDITQIFAPEILDRLREVKQRYDPENLFHSNHPVTG
jgi:hypothetical protein